MPRNSPASQGFTLMEVLVALLVAGFLLAIVMNGALTARARLASDRERAAALALAEEKLAESLAAPTAPAANGRADRLSWAVAVTPLAADRRGLFQLEEISVVTGTEGAPALVRLSRRRLVTVRGNP